MKRPEPRPKSESRQRSVAAFGSFSTMIAGNRGFGNSGRRVPMKRRANLVSTSSQRTPAGTRRRRFRFRFPRQDTSCVPPVPPDARRDPAPPSCSRVSSAFPGCILAARPGADPCSTPAAALPGRGRELLGTAAFSFCSVSRASRSRSPEKLRRTCLWLAPSTPPTSRRARRASDRRNDGERQRGSLRSPAGRPRPPGRSGQDAGHPEADSRGRVPGMRRGALPGRPPPGLEPRGSLCRVRATIPLADAQRQRLAARSTPKGKTGGGRPGFAACDRDQAGRRPRGTHHPHAKEEDSDYELERRCPASVRRSSSTRVSEDSRKVFPAP